MSVTSEEWQIGAAGAELTGQLHAVEAPEIVVSINGATGVPSRFYHAFARWLAEEKQAAVLTWDYRDFAGSGSPYGSGATMTDWATRDPLSVRAALRVRFPSLPIWVIGHSLGGMAVGFQDDIASVDRVITVASGHGHIRDLPMPFRRRARLLWHVLGPLSVLFLDHFPAKRFGLGEDLPKGVFRQWRDWLLSDAALPGDRRLGGLRQPPYAGVLTTVALADDEMLPPATVRRMAAWHPAATIDYRELTPADFGLEHLGHIHVFSARNAAVWPALIA
ncbi:alpha/beta fold hydrolase [Pararhodobacter sp. CCB-MM2]|uniref:alpha/beta hydrolase family protein n=1 Tax=Pararhodobacter sp. CCB-MM2 TaxID=1786003 RepID=UPI00082B1F99|nr:alpha/beta fold hydrolase [Pararhodobacter sp. CCB-MM2]